MKEWVELFLGDSIDYWQSSADSDGDGLDNFTEYTLRTDPLNPDTDLDGWDDNIDANPISRAVYLWGEPRFTRGFTNLYSRPLWALHGLALGGEALSDSLYGYAWGLHNQNDSLLMPLNYAVLSNDLWLAVAISGAGGVLCADILDTNFVELAGPFPLIAATDPWLTNRLPLSAYADAGAISLRSDSDGAKVVASVLYVDTDGDGLDDCQNAQLDAESDMELPAESLIVTGGMPSVIAARSGETNTSSTAHSVTGETPLKLTAIGFEPHEGYVEGAVNGQQGWIAEGSASVSTSDPFEGVQHLVLSEVAEDAASSINMARSGLLPDFTNQTVWLSMRTKIIHGNCGYEDIENPGGAATFALNAGRVIAFDGISGTWKKSERTFSVSADEWERVDVLLDYAAKTYTLCLRGVAFHRNLGFADSSLTRPEQIEIRNGRGGDAALDAVVYYDSEPDGMDFDGDGLLNSLERMIGTDIWVADTDGDGLSDYDEVMQHNTNPLLKDTDGDGLSDYDEVLLHNTNPLLADSDGDGVSDYDEVLVYGSNPHSSDTDGDGMDDRYETLFGLNPLVPDANYDPDGDGLDNLAESYLWTDPLSADTDLDGWDDYIDNEPVSRSVYLWGDPRLTHGTTNRYTRPAWAYDGFAVGGISCGSGELGLGWLLREGADDCLVMPFERSQVPDTLSIATVAVSTAEPSLWATLLNTNHVAVSPPIPLVASAGLWATNTLLLASYPEACAVALQTTQEVVIVAASVLYIDTDGDGFDDSQNAYLAANPDSPLASCPPPMLDGSFTAGTNTFSESILATTMLGIGFEVEEGYVIGSLHGQQGWSASAGAEITAADAAKGVQSLRLAAAPEAAANDTPNTATYNVTSNFTANVIWVSCMVKLSDYGSSPASVNSGAAVFALNAERVIAYDGISGAWKESERTFKGAASAWERVDIRLDYDTKTYTLCFRGVAVHRNLGFADPTLTRPNSFDIHNGAAGPTALDAVVFSLAEPAGLDFDGDGLVNDMERLLGTDPWESDTDGDGIPDDVELALGGDPLRFDPDFDNDGIPNEIETAWLGTDPALADSNANGVPDAWVIADLPGSACSRRSGAWQVTGGTLAGPEGRGRRVGYAIDLPEPGYCLAQISLAGSAATGTLFNLALFCDDAQIASYAGTIPSDGFVWQVVTPRLPAGTNLFRLAWIEDEPANRHLEISRFHLLGLDPDEDFIRAAWLAATSDTQDDDLDTLADTLEISQYLTAITRSDTDGDGLADGHEVAIFRLDPLSPDTDGDGTPDGVVVASRLGIETAARHITHISTDFTEVGGALVWANSTASSCSYDLSVSEPGFYVLEIDVRNHLYDPPDGYLFDFRASLLNREIGQLKIRGDVDYAGTGRLITPWLTPGAHRFRIAWRNLVEQGARVSRPALERVRLVAVNGVDADGDGIQDWMMERLLASNADSDGDGLKDRDEVLLYGTSPVNPDTDGDGLSDKDEILRGTDPLNPDSDGDGLNDGEEVAAGTDPLSDEFAGPWSPIDTRLGSEATTRDPKSNIEAGDLILAHRGNIEYLFTLPVATKPLLRLTGSHEWSWEAFFELPADVSDFLVYIDGEYVGRSLLRGATGHFDTMLPYLAAGQHRVRLVWNALDPRMLLRVNSVALGALGGVDANNDGILDWISSYAARTNRVTFAPATSHLSPVCLEGTARWPLLTTASTATGSLEVRPGIAGQWFANLPLDPAGAPSPLTLSFENGANTAALSVAWVPLDLTSGIKRLDARLGDTLRLGAPPDGVAVLTAVNSNGTVYGPATVDPAMPLDIALATDGEWTFTTQWSPATGPTTTHVLSLSVYGGTLPAEEPACLLGRKRDWSCPDLTPGVKMQADSGVSLAWSGASAALTVNSMYAEHFIVARAGANGPILDSRRVNHFWIQSAIDSYFKLAGKLPGLEVWENRMATLGLPADVDIELSIFVSGVTFDDLTLMRTVPGASLPGAGDYRFSMLHPNGRAGSTCHTMKAYQGGVLLGEAYHAGIGLPADLR